MAFSNGIKKTVKLFTSVVKPSGHDYGAMRIQHVTRNHVLNSNSNNIQNSKNNKYLNTSSIIWRDKYFDSCNHGGLHGRCKMNEVSLFASICDDIDDDDEEEEQDIDIDYLLCNPKLCKDNENRYITTLCAPFVFF